MRAKTALWALLLALLVSGGWCAKCFGQSNLGLMPSGNQAIVSENHPGQVFLASASPDSMVPLDSQPDTAASDAAGNAVPADPDPAPTGRNSPSHVGIGVKLSTLGVGIEAAT